MIEEDRTERRENRKKLRRKGMSSELPGLMGARAKEETFLITTSDVRIVGPLIFSIPLFIFFFSSSLCFFPFTSPLMYYLLAYWI